jgi:hypothetical protein
MALCQQLRKSHLAHIISNGIYVAPPRAQQRVQINTLLIVYEQIELRVSVNAAEEESCSCSNILLELGS